MTRYELGERIGVGGMAEIFRGTAVAAGGFEKPVAIKRILPHLSQDQRFVNLLISEAKLLSQLRHRNIVQIFDVGLGEDGQFFLVMEYVDGADLGALYERLENARKRLPLDLSLHIVAEVCDALDYAHRARGADDERLNIVHRDVSPANILLSRSGEVKLTDFGIAKNAEETTGHGGVRGKFAYIAPEQAVNQHVDARSDVYSAGVVLYELVLGHRLYSGMPDFDALRAVRSAEVPRPREIDANIDPALEEILLTALARDPDRRFPTAGKMGSALRSFRYSLDDSEGDPANEIARVLEKASAQPSGKRGGGGGTVVRIETAAGFTATGLEVRSGPSIADMDYDAFDEEETHALEKQHLLLRPESAATPTRVRTPVPGLAEISSEDPPTDPPTDPVPPPGIEATIPERAATPTIRDLFHTGALLDDGPAQPAQQTATVRAVSDEEVLRGPRRRRAIALIVAAVVVAIASFSIASLVLSDDPPPAAMDAGPADAGPTDAAGPIDMPPDVVPNKKKKKRKKRRRK